VNSGNRLVIIASTFGAGLLLAAADAHGPGLPREPGILVAAELLPAAPGIALLDCGPGDSGERIELRFERITVDPAPDEMRLLSRGAHNTVAFEWNSETGELTYDTRATFTPPAPHGAAASSRRLASCVSR